MAIQWTSFMLGVATALGPSAVLLMALVIQFFRHKDEIDYDTDWDGGDEEPNNIIWSLERSIGSEHERN